MQTDMEMREYDGEERRALNMIWTAAEDHSFHPEFMAFDRYGKADLYLNSIIGYVHRWYDGGKLSELFGAFQGTALQDIYDTIFWLGLECGAYEKEREGRPALEELRGEYWAQVLEESKWSAQEKLVQSLQTGWGRLVLGEKPEVTPWERGILSGLSFDGAADTDEIMERVSGILWKYFRFDCRSEQKRKENRKRIKGMIKPFRFVRPARGVIVRNTLNEHGQESPESGDDQSETSGKAHKKLSDAAKGFCFWPEASSKRREEAVRSYIDACYGVSMYGERQNQAIRHMLCTGCHSTCGLHFTRGEKFRQDPDRGESARQLWEAAQQRKKNREQFEKNRSEYENSIRRLMEQIRNTLLVDLQPVPEKSRQGKLMGESVWRAVYLEDDRVFLKVSEEERQNVSVDLMLDASASRMGHEAVIAAQGYVIAESLTRCGIPVQVYSFSAIQNYTVFRIFRGYEEKEKNKGILDYVAAGWNRDGLALRAAGHLAGQSPCEKRLLIVLTDASPNDEQRMAPVSGAARGKVYSGDAGIEDTAMEVRQLKKQGIKVMAVFYGLDSDLEGARKIYGSSFVRIREMGQLADTVGNLLTSQLRSGRQQKI